MSVLAIQSVVLLHGVVNEKFANRVVWDDHTLPVGGSLQMQSIMHVSILSHYNFSPPDLLLIGNGNWRTLEP